MGSHSAPASDMPPAGHHAVTLAFSWGLHTNEAHCCSPAMSPQHPRKKESIASPHTPVAQKLNSQFSLGASPAALFSGLSHPFLK